MSERTAQGRRKRVRPGGFWQALGVVVVTFAVWGASAVADETTPARTETATTQSVRLYADPDDPGVTVKPVEGWEIVAAGSTTSLHLRHDKTVVVIDFAGEVEDMGTFFDRKSRELDATVDIEVVKGGEQRTGTGLTGLKGAAYADGRVGELVVLGKDKKGVSVFSLSDPAHAAADQAKIASMVSGIEVGK